MDSPYFIAEQIGTWLTNWEAPSALSNQNYAHAPELQVPSMGENLFRTRCEVCHTIGKDKSRTVGGGHEIEARQHRTGPDLLHVGKRRDRAWLARWLADPEKMLEEKDPVALALYAEYDEVLMPNLRLNEIEVNALITYMDAESRRVEKTADVADAAHSHAHEGHHE